MVIIDERDGADRRFVLIPFLSDQIVSDQIAKGLRSVRISSPLDVAVELLEQSVVQRHPESDEFGHAVPPW
jgi:hypothetical protein